MSRTLKILVVDDDLSIIELYRTLFGMPDEDSEVNDTLNSVLSLLGEEEEHQESAYDVTLLSQGLDAVRAAREALDAGEPFSHALIDMRMPPGIDGLETAKYLLKDTPDLDETFITAYTDYEDEQIQAVLPNGYRMLQKPFTDQQVLGLFDIEDS